MLKEPIHIALLGDLRVQYAGQTITRFRTQKTAALLAYFAYHGNRLHSREEIAGLLWPDSDASAGRASVRTALAALRQQLELPHTVAGSVILADRSHIGLNPAAFVTDVHAFEARIRIGRDVSGTSDDRFRAHTQAIELYTGELLPGYYEEWIFPQRDQLAEQYLSALRQLATFCMQAGDLQSAIDYGRRRVLADRWNEEAYTDLMRLLQAAGMRSEVRRQFKELEQMLKEDFEAQPSSEARAIAAEADRSVHAGFKSSLALLPPPSVAPITASWTAPLPAPRESALFPRLPLPLTQFFGRETEIRAVADMLSGDRDHSNPPFQDALPARLVTVTGAGGAGKTRFALEVADRAGKVFEDRILFVPLFDIIEPKRIPDAIAQAMTLAPVPGLDVSEQIITALRDLRILIVLDNFEQLVEVSDGPDLVQTFLARLPGLSCLITSRRRLEIEGEWEYALSPLPTPDHAGTPSRLLEFACVELFVNRAQASRAGFQLTQHNAEAVGALCRRLEGIPLAIELAAGWAQSLTPAQMLERLSRRFDLLVSKRKGVAARHQTLWAAIEWSYQQLSPDLQRFFLLLSVFRGGWTLEAAEGVTAMSSALNFLRQLQDRSLVMADEVEVDGTPQMRFRLLETLREFAEEQRDSEARSDARFRHGAWFLDLAEIAEDAIRGPQQACWLARLALEHENFRAALIFGLESGDAEFSQRLSGALWGFWERRGMLTEARRWLEQAIDLRRQPDSPARAKALSRFGAVLNTLGEMDSAARIHEETLSLYTALGDSKGIALAWNRIGVVAHWRGRYDEAQTAFIAALALERQLGNRFNTASALLALGILAQAQGRYDEAEKWFLEALEQYEDLNIPGCIAECLLNLAAVHTDRGGLDTATALLHRTTSLYDELGDLWSRSYAVLSRAVIARHRRQWNEATRLAGEALTTCREVKDQPQVANALSELGILAHCTGDRQQATAQLGEALRLFHSLGYHTNLPGCLREFGAIAAAHGDFVRAARLFGAAEAWRERVRRRLSSVERPRYEEDVSCIHAALGDSAFRLHWDAGRSLPEDEALSEALDENSSSTVL